MFESNIEPIAVSVSDAAKLIGISRSSCYELIQNSSLRTVKLGSRRLVPMSALRELVGE